MTKKIKAQVSVEYLAVIAFVLILVFAAFAYAMFFMQQQADLKKSFNAALTLRNAVNEVHSLAPGSKITVEVILPSNVKQSYINGKYAGWIVSFGNSEIFAVYETDANVTGYLPINEGVNYITLEVLKSGIVQFGRGLTLTPEAVVKTVVPGTHETQSFILTNETNENITGITATINSSLTGYATIVSYPTSLPAGTTGNIIIDLNVASDANAQTIYGYLKVNSNQNYMAESLVGLNIPHILGRIEVNTFEDDSYTTLKDNFVVTQPIYYEARFYDDKNNAIDIEDFNVFIKDSSNTIAQQKLYQVSDNTVYRSYYISDCAAAAGTWKVQVDANSIQFVSSSHDFFLSGGSQANNFTLDWNTAYFIAAGTKLYNWKIANYTGCGSIVIDKVLLEWTNDTDDAKFKRLKFKRLRLNGIIVWQGSANSGQWVDIDDFTVPNYTEYFDNEIQWTKKMDNESENIRITLQFDDNSTYTSTWYTP